MTSNGHVSEPFAESENLVWTDFYYDFYFYFGLLRDKLVTYNCLIIVF